MFKCVVFASAAAAALGQQVAVDERDAIILREQRFNNGDGRTGAAFATENEINFREETDADGTRFGQYSYIGADGKTYFVKYSAGKEGFRILDGEHIPSTGQGAAAFVSEDAEERAAAEASQPVQAPIVPEAPAPIQDAPEPLVAAAPEPVIVSAPEPVIAPAPAVPVDYDYQVDYNDEPVDPDFNPFINPHDPTHRNFAFNKNGAKFAPKVPGVLDESHVPDCAGCSGLNPFINPFDASHQAGVLAGHQAGLGAGIPKSKLNFREKVIAAPATQPAARPAAQPDAPAARPKALLPVLRTTTTAAPKRFFPPGTISLNRFETGFNFDFES